MQAADLQNSSLFQFIEWANTFLSHSNFSPKFVMNINGICVVIYYYLGIECRIGHIIRISSTRSSNEMHLEYGGKLYKLWRHTNGIECAISSDGELNPTSIIEFDKRLPPEVHTLLTKIMNCQNITLHHKSCTAEDIIG